MRLAPLLGVALAVAACDEASQRGPEQLPPVLGEPDPCADIQPPYAGTCAEPLLDVLNCWEPTRICGPDRDRDGSWSEPVVFRYSSNATMTLTSDMVSQTAILRNPQGQNCATIESSFMDAMRRQARIDVAGKTFIYERNGGGNRIVCPDGGFVMADIRHVVQWAKCTNTPIGNCFEVRWDYCHERGSCSGGEQCCNLLGNAVCLPPPDCPGPAGG